MPSENQNNDVLISIDDVKKDFEDFLNVENNDRIFFSGKFGIGKTFFLREFAKAKENKYLTIHLFPVNYQVQNNFYDIMDLIKFDILTELLLLEKNRKINIGSLLNDNDKNVLSFILEEIDIRDFLKDASLLTGELVSKLGGFPFAGVAGSMIKFFFPRLLNIDGMFQKYKKSDINKLKNFLREIKKDKIIEDDIVSQIIRKILKSIHEKIHKKTILILDDLDRLDPDNIFRILNVFSAFFEKEHDNKFGFSKIIIVGDYNNIEKIFHHKYGEQTDFQGYIDKFFSIEPYIFDNNAAIKQKVGFLVKNIKTSSGVLADFSEITEYLITYFFEQSTEYGIVNLRQLLKGINFQIPALILKKEEKKWIRKKYFDLGLKTLFTIFNSEENFLNCILKILEQRQKNGFLYFSGNKNFFKHAIFLMLKALGDIPTNLQTITIKEYKFGDFTIPGIKVSLKNEIVQIEDKNLEKAFLIVLANYILAEGYKRYD